jgi:hypothetical protein
MLRFAALLLGAASCTLFAAPTPRALTVWLIPAEDTSPNNMARGDALLARVAAFNRSLEGSGVTVLNTTDPVLSMQLVAWNPAFVVPNGAVVLSQQRTLAALRRFAAKNGVQVRVRFITWDEAFGLLDDLNPRSRSAAYPDIVQVGSTWVAYLASRGLLDSRLTWRPDLGNWQPVAGRAAVVLPYLTDVRLLFYWRRSPASAPDSKPLEIGRSDWSGIIKSIEDGGTQGDTLALPIGLTLNLLHDYAPLVWAAPTEFVANDWSGRRIDLTSKKALSIPRQLAEAAFKETIPGRPRRLITFPETTPEDAGRIFVNGGYRAILQPANFVDRWIEDFDITAIAGLLKKLGISADTEGVSHLIQLSRAARPGVSGRDIALAVVSQAQHARRASSPLDELSSTVPVALRSGRQATSAENQEVSGIRNFWDYAGVAVPPATFRGGSDLAVLTGSALAPDAFKLADFLGSDEEFTRVLAEAGHLPSGRPGYGVDILLNEVAGDYSGPEPSRFIANIQTAIDQGSQYPQIESWPTAVENREVLEALQTVWRRIAQRDTEGIEKAAATAEWAINARMNWYYRVLDGVRRAWAPIAMVLFLAATIVIAFATRSVRAAQERNRAERGRLEAERGRLDAEGGRLTAEKRALDLDKEKVEAELKRVEAERSRILLLLLQRAYRHDAAKFLGDNFFEIATAASHENWPACQVVEAVRELSLHFKRSLVPHFDEIVEGQFREMFGEGASLPLNELCDKAYDGARYIFEARQRRKSPEIRFLPEGLANWKIDINPFALLVALEEWFLNSIDHINGRQWSDPMISITVQSADLAIESTGVISEENRAVFDQNPGAADLGATRRGLPLIRNILYYAYGTRVSVSQDASRNLIVFRVPVPFVRRKVAT